MSFDFENAVKPTNSDKLNEVQRLYAEQLKLEQVVSAMEERLAEAKKRKNYYEQKLVPEAMMETGIGSFSPDGAEYELKLSDYVSGSLPKDEVGRREAFEYLDEIEGGSSLAKTEVIMKFGKGQEEEAEAFIDMVTSSNFGSPEVKKDVHHSTLKAFAKEKLKEGDALSLDKLGLSAGKYAKLARKK